MPKKPKSETGEQAYTWSVTLRFPKEWREEIESESRDRGLPVAVFLRLLVRERLSQLRKGED